MIKINQNVNINYGCNLSSMCNAENQIIDTHSITNISIKSIRTRTVKFVLSLVHEIGRAGAIVHADVTLAAGQFNRAVLTTPHRIAATEVVRPSVDAKTMLAGLVFLAFVDVCLAVQALETLVADAGVATDVVNTLTIATGIAAAFVYVNLAIFTSRTWDAFAFVAR